MAVNGNIEHLYGGEGGNKRATSARFRARRSVEKVRRKTSRTVPWLWPEWPRAKTSARVENEAVQRPAIVMDHLVVLAPRLALSSSHRSRQLFHIEALLKAEITRRTEAKRGRRTAAVICS